MSVRILTISLKKKHKPLEEIELYEFLRVYLAGWIRTRQLFTVNADRGMARWAVQGTQSTYNVSCHQ